MDTSGQRGDPGGGGGVMVNGTGPDDDKRDGQGHGGGGFVRNQTGEPRIVLLSFL